MYAVSNCLKRGCLGRFGKLPLLPLLRTKATCGKDDGEDRCGSKFKDFPCGKPANLGTPPPKSDKAGKATKAPSLWLNPFCDEEELHCPFNPRFDDIFYVESDKAKRKYWQTWVSCPPVAIKPKKICCYKLAKAAPLRRRKRSSKPRTACPQTPHCAESDCPRLKRRCDRAGRIPPTCALARKPLICNKPLTPYPAFSECVRRRPGAQPLSECVCYKRPMLCEVWAEWRRRSMNKSAQ